MRCARTYEIACLRRAFVSPEPSPPDKESRRWPDRVRDVIAAAEEVASFVQGHSFDSFRNDARTVKAVLADFAIIGEAVMHIPEPVRAKVQQVPWRQIRAMRNIIAHVYFGVDLQKVWTTATVDIPVLIPQMQELLKLAPSE